jgi:hypothetical protein
MPRTFRAQGGIEPRSEAERVNGFLLAALSLERRAKLKGGSCVVGLLVEDLKARLGRLLESPLPCDRGDPTKSQPGVVR